MKSQSDPANDFELYKFFVELTERMVERRHAVTSTYLALTSGLFAVLSFLAKDLCLRGSALAASLGVLSLLGRVRALVPECHTLPADYWVALRAPPRDGTDTRRG